MWGFISKAIGSAGFNKSSTEQGQASLESSDDETRSSDSSEEVMECPICCESFNMVENVPYVLWCGHTLCKNCLLGLQLASFMVSNQKVQIPLFISCPWCHLLTFRLLYKGNLKFPSKNYFLLWMLENLNHDRMKSRSFTSEDHQVLCSSRSTSFIGSHSASINIRRSPSLAQSGSNNNGRNGITRFLGLERPRTSHKSLDFFIHIMLNLAPHNCSFCNTLQFHHLSSVFANYSSICSPIIPGIVLCISCLRLAGKRVCHMKYSFV